MAVTLGSEGREIASEVMPHRFGCEQTRIRTHASVGVPSAVEQAFKHCAEAPEVPRHPAEWSVAAAKQIVAERLPRQLVGDQIALNMNIPLGAEDKTKIGALQAEVAGIQVQLLGCIVTRTASAHVDGNERVAGITLGQTADTFRRRIRAIGTEM